MEFIVFLLCSSGLTIILTKSKLFEPIRPKHYFFHCPMCMGVWIGMLLFLLSPFTELFTFDYTILTALCCGWASSVTSWILALVGLTLEGE